MCIITAVPVTALCTLFLSRTTLDTCTTYMNCSAVVVALFFTAACGCVSVWCFNCSELLYTPLYVYLFS